MKTNPYHNAVNVESCHDAKFVTTVGIPGFIPATHSDANANKVGIMKTLGFQCIVCLDQPNIFWRTYYRPLVSSIMACVMNASDIQYWK